MYGNIIKEETLGQQKSSVISKVSKTTQAILMALGVYYGLPQVGSKIDGIIADKFGNDPFLLEYNLKKSHEEFTLFDGITDLNHTVQQIPLTQEEKKFYPYAYGISLYTARVEYPQKEPKPKPPLYIQNLTTALEAIGFFPRELIKKNLETIIVGSITSSSNAAAQARRDKKMIILNGEVESSTEMVVHEMIHLIFMHFVNTYWTDKWKGEFGERVEDSSQYADFPVMDPKFRNYGQWNVDEDMATMGQKMFSQTGWNSLLISTQKNQIVGKKIERMKQMFFEMSHGAMNEEYFQKIQTGEISSAKGAQGYFIGK